MRMIDGKPEYKNGLVRRRGGGSGQSVRVLWEGYEGSWVWSPGGHVLASALACLSV